MTFNGYPRTNTIAADLILGTSAASVFRSGNVDLFNCGCFPNTHTQVDSLALGGRGMSVLGEDPV